jgi:uncharacterized flavoprotein (TIGR03862 family)
MMEAVETIGADVLVCGAGPAGLAAAERAALAGAAVMVVDAKRSPGRKFLIAGRSGLNLTHAEPVAHMLERFSGSAAPWVREAIRAYPPSALRRWADDLGEATFEGTSGRVFPNSMRATPLLRAWLARLDSLGVRFQSEWKFAGMGLLAGVGRHAGQSQRFTAQATVLAFGGASWARTGSDGEWVEVLRSLGIDVADLCPSNVGVLVPWSSVLLAKYEGEPIKNVTVASGDITARGDVVITRTGLEGGPIYTVSGKVQSGMPLTMNLRPDLSHNQLRTGLQTSRSGDSLSNRLRKVGLSKPAVGLLLDCGGRRLSDDVDGLARLIQYVEIPATGVAAVDRAISSGGGVVGSMINAGGMLRLLPGTFVGGEMLDWDAPTGGYLLQGCWSTGCRVGDAAADYVGR